MRSMSAVKLVIAAVLTTILAFGACFAHLSRQAQASPDTAATHAAQVNKAIHDAEHLLADKPPTR